MTISDRNIATIRTAVPGAWATIIVWLIAKLGLNLDANDWSILCLILPAIVGVFYRAAREIEGRWPTIGRILFGSGATPRYGSPSPDERP